MCSLMTDAAPAAARYVLDLAILSVGIHETAEPLAEWMWEGLGID